MAKLFGTDGVRGVANRDLTAELAYRLGRAGAYILAKNTDYRKPLIVIGQDTRISGHMLEGAMIAGICSVGGNVVKAGVIPTPGVSYLTRLLNATAGVMISASHNPVEDNGIKFFSSTGYKLPDSVEEEIEQLALSVDNMPFPTGEMLGSVKELNDACEKYISFAKNTIDTKLNGVKVVIDCANGAAFQAAPQALKELGAEVIVINNQPNGININKNCGSTHPEQLQKEVLKQGADIGIAHDGDADRMIAVDEKGNIVDGDQIMVACGLYLKKKGLLKDNSLVVTVMSNIGLHLALKQAGITVYQTQVGDRYVLEKMIEAGCNLGGEQSGHIIFLDHNTTGDGLVTALQLLQVMSDTGKTLSQLAAQMEIFPQILLNARVKNKDRVMSNPTFLKAVKEIEGKLKGEGRVLVRPSGTEPLVRVMVEGPKDDLIKTMAEELADLALKLDEKL
ncbi:phosphoglucosamine mutase [Desulfitibacter alkalitolerans]|uniref:phosphoglucosamine mutase n=1 Tax=Desulfitibacter alkalitolerans TaxID=264641 RepID=UPI000487E45E|nr:phosphoglucosamine mutase [Desulfitibacter alkalitolerans]